MKTILFSLALLFLPAFSARAEPIPMLEHLQNVNKIICKCKIKSGNTGPCEQQMYNLSSANLSNHKTVVDDFNSSVCIGYLEVTDCKDVMMESTQGPCSLAELQKK